MSKKHDEMRAQFWHREAVDCLRSIGVKDCPESLIQKTVEVLRERSLVELAAENQLLEEM